MPTTLKPMRLLPQLKRILIVDDDAEYRSAICELLESHGFVAVEVGDGRAALDYVVSEKTPEPSLIILDMEMPRLSGWEFLAIIKSYYRLSSIPVIVISGRNHSEALRHNAIEGYLLKPYNPNELLRLVSGLLDKAGSSESAG
jgi:CheY-like chemotaxis protein